MTTAPVPVSIVKCSSYDEDLVYQKVGEAVDLLGGIQKFVTPGQRVLLKPNMLSGRPPEKCVTTHPLVVKAVAAIVLEAGATPVIGDSPQIETALKAAGKCGIEQIAKDLGIDIVEFEPVTVQNPDGKMFKHFTIGKIINEVDGIINIAKFKTHGLTTLTLTVKNMLGCVPGTRKAEWHLKTFRGGKDYFTRLLLDLYTFVNPVLNILDGITAMEGMGPGFGKPRHVGLLIAGADGVAVDRIATEVVNIPPEKVYVLQMAVQEGYGRGRMEEIEVVGEKLDDVKVMDFKPPPGEDPFLKIPWPILQFLKTYLTNHPVIMRKVCELCTLCLEACPMKCIAKEEDTMQINRKKCIQCFCCMEACPHGAINLKPGGLLRAYLTVRKLF